MPSRPKWPVGSQTTTEEGSNSVSKMRATTCEIICLNNRYKIASYIQYMNKKSFLIFGLVFWISFPNQRVYFCRTLYNKCFSYVVRIFYHIDRRFRFDIAPPIHERSPLRRKRKPASKIGRRIAEKRFLSADLLGFPASFRTRDFRASRIVSRTFRVHGDARVRYA